MIALGAFSAIALSIRIVTSAVLSWQENKLKYSGPGSRLDTETGARLERMEQAVDAIAIEIERISEGQRFTTKLLAQTALTPRSEHVTHS